VLDPVIVPTFEPVIVPSREPVIVPVRDPVIVPTREAEPVMVPALEIVTNESNITPAAIMFRSRVILILLVD
jgi:hypothetical protein